MMNSVHNLPTNLPTEFIPSVIPLVKMARHHFFLLCFNFFSHGNSLGISVCIYQFSGSAPFMGRVCVLKNLYSKVFLDPALLVKTYQ
jgi:hypothetical protein